MRLRSALLILGLITFVGCIYTWNAYPFYKGTWVGNLYVNGKEGPLAYLKLNKKGNHLFADYDYLDLAYDDPIRKTIPKSRSCRFDLPDRPTDNRKRDVMYHFSDNICGDYLFHFKNSGYLGLVIDGKHGFVFERQKYRDPILNKAMSSNFMEEKGKVRP